MKLESYKISIADILDSILENNYCMHCLYEQYPSILVKYYVRKMVVDHTLAVDISLMIYD